MSGRKWTVDDVQQLVVAAKEVLGCVEAWNEPRMKLYEYHAGKPIVWGSLGVLESALKPFQSDPDAELVEKLNELRGYSAQSGSASAFSRSLIAAVRDHDAKAVAK